MAVDTPNTLSQRLRGREEVTVEVAGVSAPELRAALLSVAGVDGVGIDDPEGGGVVTVRIQSALGLDVRGEVARALAARWQLLALRSESLSLEEIFLKLTAENREPGAESREPS
jgi:hypothetical protein